MQLLPEDMSVKEDYVGYATKRLSKETISDLATLHTAVYGRIPPPGFFVKKYDTAYTGLAYTGFIAYTNEMVPIAYYGVIPCFISSGGRTILAAQSSDTMTHPGYRNKGLFVKLAELTFELCRSAGIGILFGFPNQHSLPGFLHKLGWQHSGAMECFIIPVRTLPLERIAAGFSFLKKCYAWYAAKVLNGYLVRQQGIKGSVLQEGYDSVLRNADYLKYKTYTDTFVIGIEGTDLWLKINGGLLIGDVSDTAADLTRVMDRLSALARRLGLRQIQCHASSGTGLHTFFAAHYRAVPSFPVIFKILDDRRLPTDRMKFTFADIDIF